MNILHIINNLTSGGAEKLLTDILPRFKKEGHDVAVLISNSNANIGKYEDILTEANVRIINLDTSFYNPWQIVRIAKLVNREKFDIVHAHLFPTQYWLALASLFFSHKTKLIKTEHSVFNERKDYKILRPLEKFIYGRYKVIIGITEEVRQNLSQWINQDEKMVVVPNGVNLDQVQEANKHPMPEFYNDSKKTLLMVARFDESQKDHTTLIEAFSMLKDKDQYELFLVGEGPNQEHIQEMVKGKGLQDKVHFLGRRTDVYNLMNKADLNILSTLHEGLSGVTLESLASGKPFIGSDVVGVNDVVPDSSFLVKGQDASSLARKIEELTQNEAIIVNNITKAIEHVKKFDTNFMVESYLDIYKQALKNKQ